MYNNVFYYTLFSQHFPTLQNIGSAWASYSHYAMQIYIFTLEGTLVLQSYQDVQQQWFEDQASAAASASPSTSRATTVRCRGWWLHLNNIVQVRFWAFAFRYIFTLNIGATDWPGILSWHSLRKRIKSRLDNSSELKDLCVFILKSVDTEGYLVGRRKTICPDSFSL